MEVCICLACCCCCSILGIIIFSFTAGKIMLPSILESIFYYTKISTIYGFIFFIYMLIFCLIVLAVNEMLKCIVSFKEDIQLIDKEKVYHQKRRQTLWILTIILCNLALISLSIYLSFYFESIFLKTPIIFYISYSLAVAASFPAKKAPSFKKYWSDSFSDHFTFKIIFNFILIVGCFITREIYIYYNEKGK